MTPPPFERLIKIHPIDVALAQEFAYDRYTPDRFDTPEFSALRLMLTHAVRGTPIIPSWDKNEADKSYAALGDKHRVLILGFGASANAAASAVLEAGHIPIVIGDKIGGQAAGLISHVLHEDTTRAGGGTNILHTMSQPGVLAIPGQWVDLKDVPKLVKKYGISAVVNATGSLMEKRSKPLSKEYDGEQVITIRELVDVVNQAILQKIPLTETQFGEARFVVAEAAGKATMNDGVTAAEILTQISLIESASNVKIDPRKLAKTYPKDVKLKESEAVAFNLRRLNPDIYQYQSNVVVARGNRETSRALAISAKDLADTRAMIKSGELLPQLLELLKQRYTENADKVKIIIDNLDPSVEVDKLPFPDQKELMIVLGELTRLHNSKYQAKNKAEFLEWEKGVGFSFISESTVVGVIRHPDTGKVIGAKIVNNRSGKKQSVLANLIVTGHGTEPNLLKDHLNESLGVPHIDVGFAVSGTTIAAASAEAKKAVAHLVTLLKDEPPKPSHENMQLVQEIHLLQEEAGAANLTEYFINSSDSGYTEEWRLSPIPTPQDLSDIPTTIQQYTDLVFNNPKIKSSIPHGEKPKIYSAIKTTVLTRYFNRFFQNKYPELSDDEVTKIALQYQSRFSLNKDNNLKFNGYTSPATIREVEDDMDRWMQNRRLKSIGAEVVRNARRYKAEAVAAVGGLLAGAAASLLNVDPKTFIEATTAALSLDSVAVSALSTAQALVPKHREKLGKAAQIAEMLGIGMLGAAFGFGLTETLTPSTPTTPDSTVKHAHGYTPIDPPLLETPLDPTPSTAVETSLLTPPPGLIPHNFSSMTDSELLTHIETFLGENNWENPGPFHDYNGRPVTLADVIFKVIRFNQDSYTPTEVAATLQIAETKNLADLITLIRQGVYQTVFSN